MRNSPFTMIILIMITLTAFLVLSACAPPQVDPQVTPEPTPADLPAAQSARQALAQELVISPGQIEVVLVEEAEWPDACLGLPEPGEFCAAVITPGYWVILEAEGEQHEVRTDLDGDMVRMQVEEPVSVEAARQVLAQELGVKPDQILVVEVGEAEWPDSCLGLAGPGEMCLTVITPGYRMILEAEGEQYEVRTDLDGDTVRVEGAGQAEAAVEAARQALAQELDLDASDIEVTLVMDQVFPNACLGLAEEDEMCAEVIVEGWIIELMAQGQTYVFHSDSDGSSLRLSPSAHEGGAAGPIVSNGEAASPADSQVVSAAKEVLSSRTGTPIDEITLVEITQVDWRDGCLEVHTEGTMCIMVITPGYRVILEAGGQKYEVRTNLSGTQAVIAGAGSSVPSLIEE
jgi:hypothetical protein